MCRLVVGVICVLASLGTAVGQSTFGSIVGVVHDKTDAVVPGATVQNSQGNIALAGATANMVSYSVDGISTANIFVRRAEPSIRRMEPGHDHPD
jgi:hypothetical protein